LRRSSPPCRRQPGFSRSGGRSASSSTMSEPAVLLSGVTKAYRLYHSRLAKIVDAVGLPGMGRRRRYEEFEALKGIDLEVRPGAFLQQPLKTYSRGMQSRLMFATATAIAPEVLVVDEVLGAGDAYFTVKSAARMQRLAASGCTLIIVSHSMPHILQFCDRALW